MAQFLSRTAGFVLAASLSGVAVAAAPSAPTNLMLGVESTSKISLSWQDNANNETAYEVERRLSSQTTFTRVATLGANATSYSDASLAEGSKYYYRVRATAGTSTSRYSNTANATTLVSIPAAPSGLSASSVASTKVTLSWVDNASNESNYKVERKTGTAGTYQEIVSLGTNATSYTSSGLTEGTDYFFRVRASNSGGASGYSNELKVATTIATPKAPSGLTLTPSATQMSLAWTDNSTNETGFEIERKKGSGGTYVTIYTASSNQTSLMDSGLDEGSIYFYRVRAVNSAGASSYSTASSTTLISAPSRMAATAVALSLNPFEVTLSWQDNSSGESGYLLEEATSSSGPWTQVAKVGADVTGFTRTGLTASTMYFYRVRAYVGPNYSSYSSVTNVRTAARRTSSVPSPRGIYLLSDNSGPTNLDSLPSADKSFIDGFAWRVSWNALDTGTTGPNYDFSSVDQAIAGVQAMGKKLTIALLVLSVPDYVLNSAQDTWFAPGVLRGTTVKTVVPWDANAMVHFQAFMAALASHQVRDSVSGTMKPLRDHPALGQINAAVLGLQGVRDTSGVLVTLPGFSRDAFKQALRGSMHATVDQFPSKPNYVAYWGLDDGAQPALGDELLLTLMDEFDGVKNPMLGFFNEALRGDSPGPTPYQSASGNGYPVLFQACGSWLLQDPCNWTVGDDTPANGFNYGSQTFGAKYYEIYRSDVDNPNFAPAFNTWHPIVNAN